METGLAQLAAKRWHAQNLFNYVLVVQPAGQLYDKLLNEKQLLYKFTGSIPEIKPHIELATFTAREDMEETLIRYMLRICSQQQSFQVELNNYSGFPPGSIHLRVQNNPFKQFIQALTSINGYISSCGCHPLKLVQQPHLSIAHQLPEHFYLKALMAYSQKTFHETFIANEILLLRYSDFETPKRINVFQLQPMDRSNYN